MCIYILRAGSVLDKGTNEKQPYMYIYTYIIYACINVALVLAAQMLHNERTSLIWQRLT